MGIFNTGKKKTSCCLKISRSQNIYDNFIVCFTGAANLESPLGELSTPVRYWPLRHLLTISKSKLCPNVYIQMKHNRHQKSKSKGSNLFDLPYLRASNVLYWDILSSLHALGLATVQLICYVKYVFFFPFRIVRRLLRCLGNKKDFLFCIQRIKGDHLSLHFGVPIQK